MYQPSNYKNDAPEFIFNFIRQHPFAIIILKGTDLLATHVPILAEGTAEKFRLYGHIANHNPMHRFLEDNKEILVVFKGPDAYISSSWYAMPEIPTWDYTAVHVNATVQLQSSSELQTSLENLITFSERDLKNPLNSQEIPQSIWEENFKGITGFWLHPFRAVGIEKLHQGFEKEDVRNIVRQLKSTKGCPNDKLVDLLNEKHDNPN